MRETEETDFLGKWKECGVLVAFHSSRVIMQNEFHVSTNYLLITYVIYVFVLDFNIFFFRKVNATRLVPAYNRNSMSGGSGNTFKRSTVFTHSRLFFIKLNEIRFYENPQHKTFR